MANDFIAEFFAVGLFSYLGVFIRVELSRKLTDYEGSIGAYSLLFTEQHYLISNILGCFLIAVLISHKDVLSSFSLAAHIGLTSGLCGSLTTFSTWMVTNFESLFTKQNIGYFIIRLIVQYSLTWSALSFGFYLARMWSTVVKTKDSSGEIEMQIVAVNDVEEAKEECLGGDSPAAEIKSDCTVSVEGYVWITLFAATTIALVVALITLETTDKGADGLDSLAIDRLRCLVLAPPGAWLRWTISNSKLKDVWPECHLQTLSVNLAAVLIASCLTDNVHNIWRQSIISGFCGSLSTVSTFFSEIYKLNNEKGPAIAARYCLVTIIPAVAIVQILLQIKQDTDNR